MLFYEHRDPQLQAHWRNQLGTHFNEQLFPSFIFDAIRIFRGSGLGDLLDPEDGFTEEEIKEMQLDAIRDNDRLNELEHALDEGTMEEGEWEEFQELGGDLHTDDRLTDVIFDHDRIAFLFVQEIMELIDFLANNLYWTEDPKVSTLPDLNTLQDELRIYLCNLYMITHFYPISSQTFARRAKLFYGEQVFQASSVPAYFFTQQRASYWNLLKIRFPSEEVSAVV